MGPMLGESNNTNVGNFEEFPLDWVGNIMKPVISRGGYFQWWKLSIQGKQNLLYQVS